MNTVNYHTSGTLQWNTVDFESHKLRTELLCTLTNIMNQCSTCKKLACGVQTLGRPAGTKNEKSTHMINVSPTAAPGTTQLPMSCQVCKAEGRARRAASLSASIAAEAEATGADVSVATGGTSAVGATAASGRSSAYRSFSPLPLQGQSQAGHPTSCLIGALRVACLAT